MVMEEVYIVMKLSMLRGQECLFIVLKFVKCNDNN